MERKCRIAVDIDVRSPTVRVRLAAVADSSRVTAALDAVERKWPEVNRLFADEDRDRTRLPNREIAPDFGVEVVRRHSRVLVEGRHMDTNLNRERMRRIVPAAVRAAGLARGQDVTA